MDSENRLPEVLAPITLPSRTVFVFVASEWSSRRHDMSQWWKAVVAMRTTIVAAVAGWVALFLFNLWSAQPYSLYLAQKAKKTPQVSQTESRVVERVDPNPALVAQLTDAQVKLNNVAGERDRLATENQRLATETATLRDRLRDKRNIQVALKTLAAEKERWNTFFKRTEPICRIDQVAGIPEAYGVTARATREALEALGYADYVDDFQDMSNCQATGVASVCFPGGFNPEATKWHSSAACRMRNLGTIIDRLRAAGAALR